MPEIPPPPAYPAEDPAALAQWEDLGQRVQAGHFGDMPAPFMGHVRRNLEQHGFDVDQPVAETPLPAAAVNQVTEIKDDWMDVYDAVMSPNTTSEDEAQERLLRFRTATDELDRLGSQAGEKTKLFNEAYDALEPLEVSQLPDGQLNELIREMAICDQRVFDRLPHDKQLTWSQSLTTQALLRLLPEATLRRFYGQTEIDGGEQNFLHTFLEYLPLTEKLAVHPASLLAVIYRADGGIENLSPGDDAHMDRLRPFISTEQAHKIDTDALIHSLPERPAGADQASVKAFNDEWRDQARIIFDRFGLKGKVKEEMAIEGLPDQLGRFMLRVMSARLRDEEDGTHYDTKKAQTQFARINNLVSEVGVPLIEKLHDKLGIVNLDTYSVADLKSLEKLLDGDAEFIQHLQNGDTTVVLADALGDHNGAVSHAFDIYRRPDNRTLMFEVSGRAGFTGL